MYTENESIPFSLTETRKINLAATFQSVNIQREKSTARNKEVYNIRTL